MAAANGGFWFGKPSAPWGPFALNDMGCWRKRPMHGLGCGLYSSGLDWKEVPKIRAPMYQWSTRIRPLLPLSRLRRLAYLEFVRPDPRCNLQPGCFAVLAGGGVNSALIHLDLTPCGTCSMTCLQKNLALCLPSLRVLLIRHTSCSYVCAAAIGSNCHKRCVWTQLYIDDGKGPNNIFKGACSFPSQSSVFETHVARRAPSR